MKKHIANLLTGSRILFSLPLLFIPLSSAWFYVFYLFCGLTDMIDGAVARRTGAVSSFGARLDTVADLVFLLVCGGRILPLVHIPVWLWGWIVIVALMKMLSIVFCFLRGKTLLSIHSVCNKITGLALFLLPFTLTFVEPIYSVSVVCVPATIAAMQEIGFVAKGQEIL